MFLLFNWSNYIQLGLWAYIWILFWLALCFRRKFESDILSSISEILCIPRNYWTIIGDVRFFSKWTLFNVMSLIIIGDLIKFTHSHVQQSPIPTFYYFTIQCYEQLRFNSGRWPFESSKCAQKNEWIFKSILIAE